MARKDITKEKAESLDKYAERDAILNILEKVDYLKQFEVGDIVTIRDWDCDGYMSYYRFEDQQTDIPMRYKVVHVNSKGYPYMRAIDTDGSLMNGHDFCVRDFINDYFECHAHCNYDDNFERIIEHDPDFINAAILEDNTFDPLHQYKELQREKEKQTKEQVENWYKLNEHNKKLKIHTGSERGRKSLMKKLEAGDTVWVQGVGEVELEAAGDRFLVFDTSEGLWMVEKSNLTHYNFYAKQPESLPILSMADKRKYKPKKPKQNRK